MGKKRAQGKPLIYLIVTIVAILIIVIIVWKVMGGIFGLK